MGPDGHQTTIIECIEHDDRYRHVEKTEPPADDQITCDPWPHHDWLSALFTNLTASAPRLTTMRSDIPSADARGQSRFAKNSVHRLLPKVSVLGPPRSSGITNSPSAGMKTRKKPEMMPLNDSGTTIRNSVL